MGIDPGEVYCGIAILEVPEGPTGDAELLVGMRPSIDTVVDWIEKLSPKGVHICMEEFLLYPNMKNLQAHRFSRMKTSKAIGIIEFHAKKFNVPMHQCRAVDHKVKVRDTTYLQRAGLFGEYQPTDAPHIRDATSIAVYFWMIEGIFNNGQRVLSDTDKKLLGLNT